MGVLGAINDDYKYKKVSGRMVTLIEDQKDSKILEVPVTDNDLFQEDVRLVTKDGELFYLPPVE